MSETDSVSSVGQCGCRQHIPPWNGVGLGPWRWCQERRGDCGGPWWGGNERGRVLWALIRCVTLYLCFPAERRLLLFQSPDRERQVGPCSRVLPCGRGLLFSLPRHERPRVALEQGAWV